MLRVVFTLFVFFGSTFGLAGAADVHGTGNDKKAAEQTAKDSKDQKDEKDLTDKLVVTQHTVRIHDEELKYTVTAGKLVMRDDEDKPKALVFFVAYTRDGVKDSVHRPLTFAFNGGPGSASVWLHLGLLGPKYIKLPDDASAAAPPYELSDNPRSLLDITDLVFIDPVSTGFSRPAR